MKAFAIVSVLILLLTLVGVGSMYLSATIYVEASGVTTMEATARQEFFDSLAEQVRLDAVVGTTFGSVSELSGAENYKFCIYTVHLKNNCRIPAEMVEMQISPRGSDVVQIGEAPLVTVNPGETAEVKAVLLTSMDMDAMREVTISYYMWGVPFTLKTMIQ